MGIALAFPGLCGRDLTGLYRTVDKYVGAPEEVTCSSFRLGTAARPGTWEAGEQSVSLDLEKRYGIR